MAIENLNALKPSGDIVHLRHFRDGYPLCWAEASNVDYAASSVLEEVTCPECLDIQKDDAYAS